MADTHNQQKNEWMNMKNVQSNWWIVRMFWSQFFIQPPDGAILQIIWREGRLNDDLQVIHIPFIS